jgi:xanthine dehydrogenase accessory factor
MSAAPAIPISRTASAEEVLRVTLAALEQGCRIVLGTVLRRSGSAPSTPGQKLVVLSEREAVGTLGGGALEAKLLGEMAGLLSAPGTEPVLRAVELGAELGMSCGGAVEVLLEPMDPARAVLVVGAGHVGAALAPLLAGLGFRVVLCDGRSAIVAALGATLVPSSRLRVVEGRHDAPEVLAALGVPPRSAAALVMTHDHELDREAVVWAVGQGFAFVGGVGSRNKAARLKAVLRERGHEEHAVEALRMPLGVEIGARLPAEIAVAIAAELVGWRRA